jgi:predicted TIM-barrel fold metal-dependent hydrolase
MPWIDAHVHVWTEKTGRYKHRESYPIPGGVVIKTESIEPRDFPPETILGHARGSDVDRVVLIQMSFYGTDNSYMTDTIAKRPKTFRGVGYVDPEAPGVGDTMAALLAKGVTGFRIVPVGGTEGRWLQTKGYEAMFRAAADTRQAMSCLLNPDALKEVGRMAAAHPGAPIVIDHMARIGADGQIRRAEVDALCALARHKNINVKLSAFYALSRKKPSYDDLLPMIRRLYDAYGPERLMWASDCPFETLHGTYEGSISLIRDRLDYLSKDARDHILRGTAERVYFYK